MRRSASALALTAALMGAPAAAQRPCLTAPEAEAIALVAMPEIVRQTGAVCAAALPANSLVRRTSGPFLTKYTREADRAWPAAQRSIAKLTDPAITVLLQSQYARPVLVTLLVPQLVGRIAVADCPTIDRLVTLLEPLPPRNTAGIVVTTLQYLKAEKAKRRGGIAVPDLPVCVAG